MPETFFILIGLGLLAAGGELLVRGGVGLARHWNLSPLLIGSTIVAAGTSLPELVVCLEAAFAGRPAIAIGNIIGSNIANVLLILGLVAVVRPMRFERRAFLRDAVFALIAALLVVLVARFWHTIEPWHGIVMLTLLAVYQFRNYRAERAVASASAVMHRRQASMANGATRKPSVNIVMLLVGGATLPFAADLLIRNASALAGHLGISEAVIGLSVLAVGTSLPELATSLSAAVRRQADVAIGNILGSNLFNLFGILGATAVTAGIPVPREVLTLDMWVMLAASAILLPSIYHGALGRYQGLVFLGAFVAYMTLLYLRGLPAGS